MAKIGFIGMGNMGHAMLNGVLKKYEKQELAFSDVNEDRMKKVTEETGVEHYLSNAELANNVKIIVLAVKPQFIGDVLKNIKNIVTKDHVIISIAAGVTVDYLQSALGADIRIVRAMPNTPALLGEGMTGVCYDQKLFTYEEKEDISKIFSSIGKARLIPEKMMSVVTCASGSSPAYVYMFIEALADSAVKYGMTRADAIEFAAMTVKGAADMVLSTGEHPAVLKDRVCSPGGTTIAGVSALEENGFRHAIIAATDKCYEKCTGIK